MIHIREIGSRIRRMCLLDRQFALLGRVSLIGRVTDRREARARGRHGARYTRWFAGSLLVRWFAGSFFVVSTDTLQERSNENGSMNWPQERQEVHLDSMAKTDYFVAKAFLPCPRSRCGSNSAHTSKSDCYHCHKRQNGHNEHIGPHRRDRHQRRGIWSVEPTRTRVGRLAPIRAAEATRASGSEAPGRFLTKHRLRTVDASRFASTRKQTPRPTTERRGKIYTRTTGTETCTKEAL
jgi:hypothetical protein